VFHLSTGDGRRYVCNLALIIFLQDGFLCLLSFRCLFLLVSREVMSIIMRVMCVLAGRGGKEVKELYTSVSTLKHIRLYATTYSRAKHYCRANLYVCVISWVF
jgi:hypothetical protein